MPEIRFASTHLHWHTAGVQLHDRRGEFRMALLSVCVALMLGRFGPALPGIWVPARILGLPYIPLAALSFVSGVGAASYALARASNLPAAGAGAALPAMLAALVLLPGMGALALLVPMSVSLVSDDALHRRLAPLIASAIMLAYLGEQYFPLTFPAALAALGVTVLCWRKAGSVAANDNPSLERILTLSERTLATCYDKAAEGDSKSGKRELRDVQG